MRLKRAWLQIKEFLSTPLGCQIKYYSFFYSILWCLHLILISLISYFHLLLNHNIRTIGDWIGDRGWMLIIISKCIVFYLAMQFISLKNKKSSLLKSYFRNSMQLPRKEIVAALFFLLIGLMGLGNIGFNHSMIFEMDRILYSTLGTLIFFSIDYTLLIVLEIFYPLKDEKDKSRKLFIFPLLFYFFTNATFIYEQTVSLKLYAYFFLLLYVGEWRRRNWTLPLLFLIAFCVPSYALFGLDPVWNSSYSILSMEHLISTFSIFVLIAFAVIYLENIERKNPEYIYRD